jgi:ABC-type branched-subunit amino acid transport system ATPase component
MTPDPPPRFAVPAELLRLASQDTVADAAPAAVAETLAPPPLTTATRPDGVASRAVALSVGAAVMFSPIASVWLHAGRVERALHASDTGIASVLVGAALCALGAGPLVGLASDRWGRWRVSVVAVVVGALAGGVASVAGSLAVLGVAVAVAGAAASSWATSQLSWLAEAAPDAPAALFAVHALAVPAGALLGAVAVWRWGLLLALAGVPLAAALWRAGPAGHEARSTEAALSPTAQRLRRTQSLLGLVGLAAVLALLAVGGSVLLSAHLRHAWHLGLAARTRVLGRAAVGFAVGSAASTRVGPRPAHAAVALGAAGGLFAVASYLHVLGLAELLWAGALAATTVAAVVGARAFVAVAPKDATATALGLLGAWGLAIGAGATLVLAAVGQANGTSLAQLLIGLGLLAAAVLLWRDDRAYLADFALAQATPSRHHGRALALDVRGVSFSYGARQILFDVSLGVEEGEVAALLGTNGAGKSTLLRLVAGLDHPSAGSISVGGRDTTYVEAEQIGGLGVALLAGGRMSFPSLTVMENLRLGGHRLRRQGPRLRAAIDEAMAAFPALASRRDQRVGTLSGGEQQMLALARVLLTRPRLLLIDELSLGLAPKAVEDLLATVRRVNDEGATVLLVEQSANLALTLARHAFFLERGEVRFDGPTAELLTRDDLLRPVFLGKT